jgi:hypothetical protein
MAKKIEKAAAKAEHGKGIVSFFHCARCLMTKPDGVAPREWAQLEVGWTKEGLQVWCRRHELNVYDLDFVGQKVEVRHGR